MNVIETHELTKAYNEISVVKRCSLSIGEGQIYGFIGRNGAGKSTVMKMICGLVTPTSGEILLFGRSPDNQPTGDSRNRIGALIEQPGLLPQFTARENLQIKARAIGMKADRSSIQDLLDAVQLPGDDRKVKGFSLGMRQRLGIAMAMLGSPSVLLLDEPLNGLDPQGIRDMRIMLKTLCEEQGVTIFISSHILGELGRLATRFSVINEGSLVAELTDKDVAEACVDSLVVGTTDPMSAKTMLEQALSQCQISLHDDGLIFISGPYDSMEVARLLYDSHQMVTELHVHSQDPEEYFLKLMGRQTMLSPSASEQVGGPSALEPSIAESAYGSFIHGDSSDEEPPSDEGRASEGPADASYAEDQHAQASDNDPYSLYKKGTDHD